jgi:outer membrane biosynthesis protein TonB
MAVVSMRQITDFHKDPKFGRLLLASLVVHGLVWAGFAGDWFGSSTRPKPPVYYVDLIHKPVLNPQAGRPDPRPAKKRQAAPVKRASMTPRAAKKQAKPDIKPLVKPTPTARPKPVPKPEPRQQQQVQSAIDEIRQRQAREAERDALKDKLAKLRESAAAAATVSTDVPVGMPDGTGDEVGVSALAFVQAFIQQNWALSPYLLDQSRIANIEAKTKLVYAADGRLKSFRIESPSGNQQFDDSLKKAIIKSQQLPQPLPKGLELVVIFNLKEMAATRR